MIDPVVYPGVRIVAAWKNGTLASLSAEDAALYEEAQAIVDAAKAASGGDPLALESYLYNYSLVAVTARQTNPSGTSARRAVVRPRQLSGIQRRVLSSGKPLRVRRAPGVIFWGKSPLCA